MSAGPRDFKRVAKVLKGLLKLRKSDGWVLSVAPRSQILVSGLDARKKRPPRGAVLAVPGRRDLGLEVETPPGVEHIEVVTDSGTSRNVPKVLHVVDDLQRATKLRSASKC